ncbi:MAG: acyltransferase domain-containing protein [Clostridia bacterium]|nr:acyltransferase domain-containing protein [Clostridia bacterium]
METEQFMKEIHLPKEGQLCVSSFIMPEENYRKFKILFYESAETFFQIIDNEPEKEKLLLYLYVRFAADLHAKYAEAGISDKIYYDTFSDFTIWFNHCLKEKHTTGLAEARWLELHLKMKLFRLGRLQFEKDEKANRLHIHIPEGSPLSPEECDKSLAQAEDFFDDSYTEFDCDSWLLSPALSEMLDENNRIIQFQKRFKIERINPHSRQAEERVFGTIQEDKTLYPEQTRLQKTLKKYLLSGKNPGAGFGTIKMRRGD